jgi:hypothetical protein
MIEQTEPTGLHYRSNAVKELVLGTNPGKHYVKPNPDAEPHNSMNWAWAILEFLPRLHPQDSRRPSLLGLSIPFFERRTIPEGATIHRSVLNAAQTAGRVSANLPSQYVVEEPPGPNG